MKNFEDFKAEFGEETEYNLDPERLSDRDRLLNRCKERCLYLITDSGKTFKTENGAIKNADDTTHGNEATDIAFKVENTPGAALPNTGGPGTTLIYLLGIMCTGIAGVGLAMKRRRKKVA